MFDLKTILLPTLIAVLLTATLTQEYPIKFSYSGETGPEKWGSLNPSFSTCSNGKSQSPINIVHKQCAFNQKLGPLTRTYTSANGTLINNGFNIGLQYSNGCGKAMIDGKNYTLKQIHWHSPAEHTIDGIRYPLELHLVHKTDDGSISVVAIHYQYGKPDPILNQLKSPVHELVKIKSASNNEVSIPVGLMRSKFLNRKTRKYYRYVGSLTVPPCTENITWNILGKVREVSKEQVEALKAPLDGSCKDNCRPIQPLNGRHVQLYQELEPKQ